MATKRTKIGPKKLQLVDGESNFNLIREPTALYNMPSTYNIVSLFKQFR